MDASPVLGTAKDPWPYDFVIQGLQFFAMSVDSLRSYLPAPFSETLFHGYSGDFLTTSPLVALFQIHSECVEPGLDWNSWSESTDRQDDSIEEEFRELSAKAYLTADLLSFP